MVCVDKVSEKARASTRQKLALLKRMNRLLKKSKFAEKDAVEMGRKANRRLAKITLEESRLLTSL